MRSLTFFLLILLGAYQISAQSYGWMDISSGIPDYPFDTTIINDGADTIIAQLTDVYFINDDEGWVTVWHPFDGDQSTILHTENGGSNWEVQTTSTSTRAIWMLDENTGYAGNQCQIMGYVSPAIPWVVTGLTNSLTQGVFALDSNHVWVVGFGGLIMSTTNGSDFDRDLQGNATVNVVWETAIHPRIDINLANVFFTSTTNGYAVGAKNTILKYTMVTATEEPVPIVIDFEVFPNPFNEQINIQFSLETPEYVQFDLLDVFGRVVLTQFEGRFASGQHKTTLLTGELPAGVNFIRLRAGSASGTEKVLKLN